MPAIISDASVLICLGAAQQLHLLREFYQEIIVPSRLIKQHSLRLGRSLYEQILQQAGETP